MDLWTANDNYLKSIAQEKTGTAQNVSTFKNAKHDPEPIEQRPAEQTEQTEQKPTEQTEQKPAEQTEQGGNE